MRLTSCQIFNRLFAIAANNAINQYPLTPSYFWQQSKSWQSKHSAIATDHRYLAARQAKAKAELLSDCGYIISDGTSYPTHEPETFQLRETKSGNVIKTIEGGYYAECGRFSDEPFSHFVAQSSSGKDTSYKITLGVRRGFSDHSKNPITHSVVLIEKDGEIAIFGMGNTGWDKRGEVINDVTGQAMKNDYIFYPQTALTLTKTEMADYAIQLTKEAQSRYQLFNNNCFSVTTKPHLSQLIKQDIGVRARVMMGLVGYSQDNNWGMGTVNNRQYQQRLATVAEKTRPTIESDDEVAQTSHMSLR